MVTRLLCRVWLMAGLAVLIAPVALMAQQPEGQAVVHRPGGEVNIQLPDLNQGDFLGMTGHQILLSGLVVCVLGLLFGLWTYTAVKNLPVHKSMADVSAIIYETCKAYLIQQGKFLLILELFIGTVMVAYFWLTGLEAYRIAIVLIFSLIGIGGSYGVAWYGIRINTLANSRTAFASLQGKAFAVCDIPLRAGMSVGMMLISVELLFMLAILLFIPGEYAGVCFLGFAIGESLGAAALRIAGGIFTKIADIGSDLMKVVFKIKEDDARNPGVIADCTGDNAGDSVGPTADGFETYGVTGVALITFIMLAVKDPATQVQLLVWIFMMRVMMVLASAGSYLVNNAIATASYGSAAKMNFEAPLTTLVWLTSIVSVVLTYVLSYLLIPVARRQHLAVVAAVDRHHLRHARGRDHPGVREGVHLDPLVACARGGDLVARRRRVAQHPVGSGRGQLQRLLARPHDHGPDDDRLPGGLDGLSSTMIGGVPLMVAPAIFAFGLVAFGFLGMGPVTIAVDSYGPVTDNAQSVYELSQIEEIPGHRAGAPERVRLPGQLHGRQGAARGERRRRQHLQGDRQAGADRHRRRRRDDDDLRDHHGADAGADGRGGDRASCRSCTRRSCSA